MFDSFKGRITFEAVSPDTSDFINAIKESCISADNIRYKNGKIIGEIYKNDFAELKEVGNSCNAQISILERSGIIFDVQRYKKRIGLVVGAVIALWIIVFLSDIVMIIDVYGNEKISDSRILSLANDAGIYIGAHISDIDLRKAERVMVSSSDGISWIGIRSSGSKVQIEVSEMDNIPELVPKNIPCNIVSTKDAQIVGINNVYSGMLVQLINNGVKKGDLLISGTVDDGKGGVYYTHSIGEIIGRYTETITFTQPYIDEIIEYTDKSVVKSIHFLGCKIPLSLKKNNLENYEFNEKITYLELLGIQLPIGMVYSEYKTYTIQQIEYDSEQAKNILLDKIKQYEHNFFADEDVIIIDKKVEYVEINGSLKASVRYTVEGNIGVSKEIMVK